MHSISVTSLFIHPVQSPPVTSTHFISVFWSRLPFPSSLHDFLSHNVLDNAPPPISFPIFLLPETFSQTSFKLIRVQETPSVHPPVYLSTPHTTIPNLKPQNTTRLSSPCSVAFPPANQKYPPPNPNPKLTVQLHDVSTSASPHPSLP